MNKRLKDGERTARRMRSPFDFIPGTKVDDFLGPWVATLVLLVAGLVLRNASWGMTALWSRLLGMLGVIICTAILAYVVAVYAEPRHPFLRRHAIVSTGLWESILAITLLIGAQRAWVWVLIFGGSTLCLSWNVRDLRPLRSKGEDRHGADVDPDPYGVGIDQATIDVIRSEVDRAKRDGRSAIAMRLRGRGVQGYADIVKAVPALNNLLSLPSGRVRAIAAPDEGSDIADLHITLTDIQSRTVALPEWDGVRTSVIDGVWIGEYEDGTPCILHPAGGVCAPSQLGVMGMTRSGKSHAFRIFVLMLSRMFDAVLWVLDATKADQTVGILSPACSLIADTPEKAKYVLESLTECIKMRGRLLASLGGEDGDEWKPGCGIPALFVWVEEAADLLAGSDLWERLCRSSLSVGIFLVSSLQRADGTNVKTGARAQLGSVVCFGVRTKTDARFFFPNPEDAQIVDALSRLKTKKQGTFFVDCPDTDDLHRTMSARTPWTDGIRTAIESEILDDAAGMAVPDETISWVDPDSIGSPSVRPPGQADGRTESGRTARTDVVVSTTDRRTALLSAIERTALPDSDGRLSVTPRGLITHLSRNTEWWKASMQPWLMGELKALASGDAPALYRAEHGVYRLTGREG